MWCQVPHVLHTKIAYSIEKGAPEEAPGNALGRSGLGHRSVSPYLVGAGTSPGLGGLRRPMQAVREPWRWAGGREVRPCNNGNWARNASCFPFDKELRRSAPRQNYPYSISIADLYIKSSVLWICLTKGFILGLLEFYLRRLSEEFLGLGR